MRSNDGSVAIGHLHCHRLLGSSLSRVFTVSCGRVGSYVRSGMFNVNLRDCAINSGSFCVNCKTDHGGVMALSANRFRPARDMTSGVSSLLLCAPRVVLRIDHPIH